MAQQPQDFESAKARLEEIVNAVSDENLSLDDALDLFDEAVALGLKVSDFVEDGIVVDDEAILAESLQANAATSVGAGSANAVAPVGTTNAADSSNTGAEGAAAPQQADGATSDTSQAAAVVAE